MPHSYFPISINMQGNSFNVISIGTDGEFSVALIVHKQTNLRKTHVNFGSEIIENTDVL